MSCGVGHRHGSDLAWLWLWCKPAAAALIHPLAWEPPCVTGSALKKKPSSVTEARPRSPTPRMGLSQSPSPTASPSPAPFSFICSISQFPTHSCCSSEPLKPWRLGFARPALPRGLQFPVQNRMFFLFNSFLRLSHLPPGPPPPCLFTRITHIHLLKRIRH